ncbi:Aminoacylase-1 [Smittium mucronatum]|uniref:N-acyl-aliphatic-L-amino acid amidohydrolase n=1 Tax=Smittium mucronatum TaxID=133383 RepID=A0A1R0GL90_9FUNG|nr:Aminoacylase-1 [Smittium mucronatum]OLY77657.1 Aminoacylase-1 [Smittium mucronatum]
MTISEPASVTRFRDYVKIETVHPTPDYAKCTEFLIAQAEEIGLGHQVVELVKGKPVVILKLEGSDPSLPAILLNSHTDVVPVYREKWDYDPFAATRVEVENGDHRIYGRGTQDMKVTGSLYLEAFRQIKASGKKFLRNVYSTFVPDEEIYSIEGMMPFSKSQEFKDLNIGFGIDEGGPSINENTYYFTSERTTCPVTFTAHGNTGHGSQFIEGTAIEKLLPIINELMLLRETQLSKLKKIGGIMLFNQGQVTSVNLTMLEGGKQPNVVPATFSATFDIRITPLLDLAEFYKYLEDLAEKNECDIEFHYRDEPNKSLKITETNPFMVEIKSACSKHGLNPVEMVMPAATDARFVRQAGIQAVGINPMINHKLLAHDHNEYIIESEYIKSIPFYTDLIERLASVPN